MAPALTLVAPSGMTGDDRRAWAHAAHEAIGDVPPDLLRAAVAEAKLTADHPSKIVPAIAKYLRERRERLAQFSTTMERPTALLTDKRQAIPHDETQAILRAAGVRTIDNDPSTPTEIKGGTDKPGRTPTREDYIRLGVDPAVLDRQDDAA